MANESVSRARNWSIVVICLLSIALGFSLAANFYHNAGTPAVAAANPAMGSFNDTFTKLAEQASPSVVFITSEKKVEVSSSMPSIPDFFDFGPFKFDRPTPDKQEQVRTGTGTGFVVRSDGYIMTNDHVVGGADRVTVTLKDGREFVGKVTRDPRTDLALVKIEVEGLPALKFADSDKVKVGEWVMAIGNPFGLDHTVTVGVVSAVRTEIRPNERTPYMQPEVIQTDASINPGNSGGPLMDTQGRVIGINEAIYSGSGGNIGIGFAIPANTAVFVMDQLIDKGKVVRGYLGVTPSDLTPVLADKLGVEKGALIESVQKGYAADKAGIEIKDVVTKVNGKAIESASALRRTLQAIEPGSLVDLTLVRDKKEQTISVKLDEAPSLLEDAEKPADGDKVGMSVQPLTPELAKQIGVDETLEGVVVRKVNPGSPAHRAGIRAKDVIIEIDDTPVTSVAGFAKAVDDLKKGEVAIVVVVRGERSVIIELQID